jgi:myo-inositol 2-dehydrogenase / D-chiro-inositol 1-dehydrogenase
MVICNSAPHEFDVARWMLDTECKSISVLRPFAGGETSAGRLVNIEVNTSANYGCDVSGELVGDKGSASLRVPVNVDDNLALQQATHYPSDWQPRFVDAYRQQNRAWITSILSGKPNLAASARDGYCSTVVAKCGVKAMRNAKSIINPQFAKSKLYL